jgi:ABC-type glycerol-3-phosphate transport system permease component
MCGGELLQDYGTLLLIFPSPAIVFNISLLRQAIRTVPYDLLDAARSRDKP